jgi:hypothetical protein
MARSIAVGPDCDRARDRPATRRQRPAPGRRARRADGRRGICRSISLNRERGSTIAGFTSIATPPSQARGQCLGWSRRAGPRTRRQRGRGDWATLGQRCSRETAQPFCLPGVRGGFSRFVVAGTARVAGVLLGKRSGSGPAAVRGGSRSALCLQGVSAAFRIRRS